MVRLTIWEKTGGSYLVPCELSMIPLSPMYPFMGVCSSVRDRAGPDNRLTFFLQNVQVSVVVGRAMLIGLDGKMRADAATRNVSGAVQDPELATVLSAFMSCIRDSANSAALSAPMRYPMFLSSPAPCQCPPA